MCNCLKDKAEEIRKLKGYEYVEPPIEYLSGRAYLTFSIIKPGNKKAKEFPLLLSKCPFCGRKYDEQS